MACGLVLIKFRGSFAKYPGQTLPAVGSGDRTAGDLWPTWPAWLARQAAAFHKFNAALPVPDCLVEVGTSWLGWRGLAAGRIALLRSGVV
jgi:hypothetical protein